MSLARFNYEISPTVLIVDDNPDLVDLLSRFFSRQGVVALSASNGQQCLETAAQNPVDVIVVGLLMPGVESLKICAALKKASFTRSIPIVLLTDRNDMPIHLAAMRLGVSELVLRPIRAQDLLGRIQVHIEFSRKAHEMDRVMNHGTIETASFYDSSSGLERGRMSERKM